MSFTQNTLRSFINSDGKLILCNEPFFTHFGCCTEHLIGKSVADVFSSLEDMGLLQAVQQCRQHPDQSLTVEMEKQCKGGCNHFRWEIFSEEKEGRVTGIHIVGNYIRPKKEVFVQ
jgi:transcriptional regulator with PAS, ATPase and Fis domain